MFATATSSRKCDDVVPEFTTRGVTQNGSSTTQKEEGRRREEGDAPSPAEEGNGQEGDAQEAAPPQEEDGLAGIRFRRIDLLQEGHETPAGTCRPGFPSFGGSLR
jgi:hypothetical protein